MYSNEEKQQFIQAFGIYLAREWPDDCIVSQEGSIRLCCMNQSTNRVSIFQLTFHDEEISIGSDSYWVPRPSTEWGWSLDSRIHRATTWREFCRMANREDIHYAAWTLADWLVQNHIIVYHVVVAFDSWPIKLEPNELVNWVQEGF